MKKYKIKNSVKIIAILIILLLIIIIFLSSCDTSKSYSLEYNIDQYDISENYDINRNLYYYQITSNNKKYDFVYKSELLEDNRLLKKIKEYSNGDDTCITIKSDFIKTTPLCTRKSNQISYHLVNEKLKKELSDYYKSKESINKKINNYTLYSNENILIWNYKGFNYIKNKKNTNIKLFKEDIYEISAATHINEYILIPNYEQKYNFNELYIINLKTLKVDKWEINYDISFNCYINGVNDKSVFLTDIKNEIQYELVPHKKKMRIVGKKNKDGIVYIDGKEEKISMNELLKNDIHFTSSNPYKYILEKNNIYLSYADSKLKTKITDKKVDKIIAVKDKNVYYLIDNILYKYDSEYGETKVIEYEEWQYNDINPIFINN